MQVTTYRERSKMVHKIKELCKERNISVAEVERKAGLLGRSIKRWDENEPSVYKVYRVAKILGTTVEEILRVD